MLKRIVRFRRYVKKNKHMCFWNTKSSNATKSLILLDPLTCWVIGIICILIWISVPSLIDVYGIKRSSVINCTSLERPTCAKQYARILWRGYNNRKIMLHNSIAKTLWTMFWTKSNWSEGKVSSIVQWFVSHPYIICTCMKRSWQTLILSNSISIVYAYFQLSDWR